MFGKKLIVLAGLIVAVFAASSWAAGPYEVSDAGTEACNGTYTEDGTNDGVPKYTKTGYMICRVNYMSRWYITDSGLDAAFYINENYAATPPSSGWIVGDEGTESAPTVSLVPVEISSFSIE